LAFACEVVFWMTIARLSMMRCTMKTPTQTLLEHLRATIWARALLPGEMARVEADCFEQFVPKGGFVCRKGEPLETWVGIIDGLAKMNNFSPSGKSVTFLGVAAGGWFGEGSLLKDQFRKYDVIALRDTRVARMPRATFEWLLDISLPFNRFLLMQLNERLGQFIGTVENDRMLDVDTRVARCLAAMFNPHLYPGIDKLVHISQEEIGYLSGASRQRANQALQLLEKVGLLRLDYGGIRVLDLEGLREFQA
jgi:CRP/FNR family cyclic AMP-dependent transcriptional regulator